MLEWAGTSARDSELVVTVCTREPWTVLRTDMTCTELCVMKVNLALE